MPEDTYEQRADDKAAAAYAKASAWQGGRRAAEPHITNAKRIPKTKKATPKGHHKDKDFLEKYV